jgi:hypothetical protein
MEALAGPRRGRGPRRVAAMALAGLAVGLTVGGCGLNTGPRPPAHSPAPTVLPPAVGGLPGSSASSGGAASGAPSASSSRPSASPSVQDGSQQAAISFCDQYFAVTWTDNPPTESQKRAAPFMTPAYAARLAATTSGGGGRDWQLFVRAKETSTPHVETAIIVPEAPRTADSDFVQAVINVLTTAPDGTGGKEEMFSPTLTMVRQNGVWLVDGMHF